MIVIATIPALFALASALVYALAAHPKLVELARLAFACGLLVTLAVLSGHVLKLAM